MPVTAGALRDDHGRLLLGCRCGWQRYADLTAIPAELETATIENLQRSGRWRCAKCRRPVAAMVYAITSGTLFHQIERWTAGLDSGAAADGG